MNISKTTQNIIIGLFKVLFFVVCSIYIIDKIKTNGFTFSYFLSPIDFVIFSLLMLLNWSLEAHKWRYLVRHIEPISISKAVKATLAGLSFGLLTPNRMGNFVGKVLYLKPQNRIEGSLHAMYGNLSQMISTLLFGSICFFLTYENYYSHINGFIAFLPVLFTLILTWLFLYHDRYNLSFLNKIFNESLVASIMNLQRLKGKEKVLLLAIGRHLVFTFQYLIVLSYAPEFLFWKIFMGIQVIFFFTTMIPGLFFGKMLVRGPVAVFVLEAFGFSTSFVLSAILFIWLLNIAIPSLIGSFLFLIKKRT